MGSMSIMHWMIVVAVVVLLFGRGKISGLMGDVADGMKSFKKNMRDDEADAPKRAAGMQAGDEYHQRSLPVKQAIHRSDNPA